MTSSIAWVEDLKAVAEEDGRSAIESKNLAAYLSYCEVRNDRFRSFFEKPRPAGHPLEFADLRYQWLRGQNGQKRGLIVGFLLPPWVCMNVALCSPREDFNAESGFFKATRIPEEMQILSPSKVRRTAQLLAVVTPGTPVWGLSQHHRNGRVGRAFISIQAGPDPRQSGNLVSFPRGVDWLLGERRPSWIDTEDLPLQHPPEDCSELVMCRYLLNRDEFRYKHRQHEVLLRPIAERIASFLLLRWRRHHAQAMLQTIQEQEAAGAV